MSVKIRFRNHALISEVQLLNYSFELTQTSDNVYPLEQFLEMNERRSLTSCDGRIEAVLIDGALSNVCIENWHNEYGWADNFVWLSLRDLEQFYPRNVHVVWHWFTSEEV